MTAISINRLILPLLAAAVTGSVGFAIQYGLQEQPARNMAVTTAPGGSRPGFDAREQNAASLAKAKSEASAFVDSLIGSPPPPENSDGVPTFDVARIEPSGEAVVAGRATPGATVELLRDGEVHDRVVADASGQFVMVPPRLPSGTYDLTLRAKQADGKQATSKQRVTAVLEPKSTEQPVVALVTPDKPIVVLSQPAAPKAVTGAVVVETVEIERGGKFHVSGKANPGATLRLYLNDSFVTSVTAGAEGRFAVTINEGVAPGNYRVRLDETSGSGAVRARAEVPFTAPDTTASVSAQAATSSRPGTASQQPQLAAADGTVLPGSSSSPSTVVVPKITTTTVSRGDSLWRLSQNSYGAGTRYAVIYKANKEQIRNPNLIYPGQVLVVPAQ
ncbi:LysM peptidoglycan-binding domain-containing protein [Bradyrhizobium sp.]|uniref:LysM peptidoglycan-binding domain-containing protein n=1 Tax=Bradyrhizobium sp. TaxID=376 RepID=UPI002D1FAEA9|nr:LysM peptidoglycan-binding domain-containing protein [Bradyrhizobium sp.]